MLCVQAPAVPNLGVLAAFDWGWLYIFAFFALVAAVGTGIIMLSVWLTGGYNE
jgi:hypothetical protein